MKAEPSFRIFLRLQKITLLLVFCSYLSSFDFPKFNYVCGFAIQSCFFNFFLPLSFIVKLVFLFLETHFKLSGYFLLWWTLHLVPEGSIVYFV